MGPRKQDAAAQKRSLLIDVTFGNKPKMASSRNWGLVLGSYFWAPYIEEPRILGPC